MKELLKKLEGKLPENEIVKDADMKRYTSFKAGGKADVLVMPETQEELMYLLQAVNAADVSYMIMGNGTNILVRDGGYRGVIIKLGDAFSYVTVDG